MDKNRIPKQALQYKPKRRTQIGRPRKRWRDQFHFEDQVTGKTPNPSWTWWWWWYVYVHSLVKIMNNMTGPIPSVAILILHSHSHSHSPSYASLRQVTPHSSHKHASDLNKILLLSSIVMWVRYYLFFPHCKTDGAWR